MEFEENGPMDQLTAHLDRGWDLVTQGDFVGAMRSAERSLELDADSPEAHNLMGYIHAAEGNLDEALRFYQQAIHLDGGFIEAVLNAAELLLHPLGRIDDALELLDETLDSCQGPDELADTLLLKVDALLMRDDKEGAAAVIASLPTGPFDAPQVEMMIGRACFEVGDIEEAGAHLQTAIARGLRTPDAFYYLGLVLEAQKDANGATVAFLQSRDLDGRAEPPPWAPSPEQFERRVQLAIRRIREELQGCLEGTLVVCAELPGAEVVAEGVDPRIPFLLDDISEPGKKSTIGRLFVYQRNIERLSGNSYDLEDGLAAALEHELEAAFSSRPQTSAPR